MINYPLFFEGKVSSNSGIATTFEASSEGFPPIVCSVPKEFMGPGGGYSPEELFILANVGCFVATFKVFAEKGKLDYSGIEGSGKLSIERNEKGTPELSKLDFSFTLKRVEDQDKAKKLLAETEKYCLVGVATRSKRTYHYEFAQ